MLKQWPALLLITLLSACGGGGGGAPTPPGPAAGAALSFSPASVSAALTAGVSSTVSVAASVNRPADFDGKVFAFIIDTGGAILPDAQLQQRSSTDYLAVLHTAPTLGVGGHSGNFTVKLCRDSACAAQYPGSPMQLPYNFQVAAPDLPPFSAASAVALSASLALDGLAAAPIDVAIKAEGRSWSASSDAAWLKPAAASGSGSANLAVTLDPSGLAEGRHTATLTLAASDGQKALLPAVLTVLPSAFHVDANGIVFSAINGTSINPKTIKFSIDGSDLRWSAATDAAWLRASPSAGLAPGQTTLSVSSNDNMASGKYTARLALSTASSSRSVPVELNLIKPTLKLNVASIELGGPYGRDFSPRSLAMNLNTGANAFPWSMSPLPAWASANVATGSVNQDATTLTFSAVGNGLALGSSSVALNLGARVNGDFLLAPLTLSVKRDQRKLLPSQIGVALAATPDWTRLSRTLTVADNYALDAGWTALSDQGWLSAVASGNNLVLTANPAGLAANSINLASVKIVPADAAVGAPETITVALWNGNTAKQGHTVNQFYSDLLADPVRPLVYAHNGSSAIDIYNVYTGLKSGSISVPSTALGQMAVNAGGASLFVYDILNRSVLQYNLATLAKTASFAVASPLSSASRLQAIRPNGIEALLLQDGAAVLTSNAWLNGIALPAGELSASADGKRLYLQDRGASTNTLLSYSLDYSAAAPNNLLIARQYGGPRSGNGNGQEPRHQPGRQPPVHRQHHAGAVRGAQHGRPEHRQLPARPAGPPQQRRGRQRRPRLLRRRRQRQPQRRLAIRRQRRGAQAVPPGAAGQAVAGAPDGGLRRRHGADRPGRRRQRGLPAGRAVSGAA
ncbi:BACON domain-containing protein [Rugamonas sp. DEMB1]|uniref:BACON domain-containing protein n=1 Tax=Rugamonas sp. DEMB1 TaxID=3039386 RepID=UPI0024477E61|nr:BACON domain-containing carbohydrate-binding protein [Rugamonas sp. DEMB1]WGG51101.1 BACON domain-containing carbohydrate-binding protein [Rugamonas sp. DEMB1]